MFDWVLSQPLKMLQITFGDLHDVFDALQTSLKGFSLKHVVLTENGTVGVKLWLGLLLLFTKYPRYRGNFPF